MNDNKISELITVATKKYGMIQNPIEIKSFCDFYNKLNCKNILEIGTFLGGTFYILCKLSNLNGKKISIDYPDAGGSGIVKFKHVEIDKYLTTFADDVHIIRENSSDQICISKLSSILNGEELDFIFIDGDHSYEGVKKDFNNYKNYIKDGGYIAFHDIDFPSSLDSPGCEVYKFWNEIKNKYKFIEFKQGSFGGIGIVQVFKHKKDLNITAKYEMESSKIDLVNNDFSNLETIVSIRDRDTYIPIYHHDLNFTEQNNSFYIIPQPNYEFMKDENFSGFLIEFYDKNKNLIYNIDLKIKDRKSEPVICTRNYYAFDSLFINYKQFFYDKIYDEFIDDSIQTVVDIGANVGLFTNYISLKKNVKLIHAIEPVSKPFEELKKQFYYYHGVKCHKLGIHYNTGKIKMTVNSRETILSTFINNSHFEYEEVDVCTLPDFLNKNNLATVDLIKLDVEGLEYEILNSLNNKEILRSKKWLIEYHLNDSGKCEILQSRFSKLGFLVTNIPDKIPNNIGIQGFFFAKKI